MSEFNKPTTQLTKQLEDAREAFDAMYPIYVRNLAIEEVALHVEKLKGFGQDTISSLAIYIREMKK